MYSPTLGRWVQQDPTGYGDGMSVYESLGSHPAGRSDPYGLSTTTEPSLPPGFPGPRPTPPPSTQPAPPPATQPGAATRNAQNTRIVLPDPIVLVAVNPQGDPAKELSKAKIKHVQVLELDEHGEPIDEGEQHLDGTPRAKWRRNVTLGIRIPEGQEVFVAQFQTREHGNRQDVINNTGQQGWVRIVFIGVKKGEGRVVVFDVDNPKIAGEARVVVECE